MLAALGEAVWSEHVVGLVECVIDCTVVCALDDGMVVCPLDDGMVVCARDDGTLMCALDDDTVMLVLDDGTVMSALHEALFLLSILKVDFVDMLGTLEVSAAAGDMI